MQSRRPSGLALAVPSLPYRRSSLLSLDTAASPHTPRSCASALPPPDLFLQPTISKRTSTTSWNSSNADEMDFDWKPDQVLLLSRTLDALPAHLVTPFNGPIPPSNLLDKIARGVSQAKGPLDWPHSIRATRVKLIELARARAKDDSAVRKKKEQPQLLPPKVVVDADHDHDRGYFDDQNPIPHPDDGAARRPLYKQSSMDFITPDPAEIKDNPTIAQLSNRLQRTDRPATYHPYKAAAKTPSRIAVPRSRTTNTKTSPSTRDSSPPPASDVPDLIVPNPNSLSNSSSNSSFSSSGPLSSSALSPTAAPSGLRPPLLRRSPSTLSSSSMYSSSSGGSARALQDKRLQRVRGADMAFGPPVPPPKDYSSSKQGVTAPGTPAKGTKRAPSYGALAQGVRQEGAFLRAMKDVMAQEDDADASVDVKPKKRDAGRDKDKENSVQKQKQTHTRQPSYPSSDEEEKARAKRAKKMRGSAAAAVMSPGGVPPSPSVVSLSSSSEASGESSSLSGSGLVSEPGTPMVVQSPGATTAPCTPAAGADARAPTPPAKDRILASPKALRTPSKIPSAAKTKTKTRALLMLKPEPTMVVEFPPEEKEKAKARKPYLYAGFSETGGVNNGGNSDNSNNNAGVSASPGAPKRPTAPRMNAQRNPSMFGMELPRVSVLSSSVAAPSAPVPTPTSTLIASPGPALTPAKHKHKRTLSRESACTTSTGISATGSMGSMGSSGSRALPPLCGDAALSVPPSPLTLGFAREVRHVTRPSLESWGAAPVSVPSPAPASASAGAGTFAASASSITSLTASPAPAPTSPASPRTKTLRRVRHRLAPPFALARRISFGSLLESVDDAMDVDVHVAGDGDVGVGVGLRGRDEDDRSFDLSGGRIGMGLGGGLGLSFGVDEGKGKSGSGSVFGAVLGEAFSVQPRAVPERPTRRERERDRVRKDKERTPPPRGSGGSTAKAAGTLGSAFRMA